MGLILNIYITYNIKYAQYLYTVSIQSVILYIFSSDTYKHKH